MLCSLTAPLQLWIAMGSFAVASGASNGINGKAWKQHPCRRLAVYVRRVCGLIVGGFREHNSCVLWSG